MKTLAQLALAATLTALAVGCQTLSPGDPTDVSFDSIRGDLTPELRGLRTRQVDAKRNLAVTNNMNVRMFWDDLGRVFYTDHPSRLSPYPIMYTTGNPR